MIEWAEWQCGRLTLLLMCEIFSLHLKRHPLPWTSCGSSSIFSSYFYTPSSLLSLSLRSTSSADPMIFFVIFALLQASLFPSGWKSSLLYQLSYHWRKRSRRRRHLNWPAGFLASSENQSKSLYCQYATVERLNLRETQLPFRFRILHVLSLHSGPLGQPWTVLNRTECVHATPQKEGPRPKPVPGLAYYSLKLRLPMLLYIHGGLLSYYPTRFPCKIIFSFGAKRASACTM